MLRPGFIRAVIGSIICAVLVAVVYGVVVRPLTGANADPDVIAAGAIDHSAGAILMFAGLGAAFGWLWGVGSFSPGASAHEGPNAYYEMNKVEKPGAMVVLREFSSKAIPFVLTNTRPMIKPGLIALGICAAIVAALVFVATNPIVPVARRQTYNAVASATVMTGDKFIMFVIISAVMLAVLIGTAVGIALLVSVVNREVEVAKKSPNNPPPVPPFFFRLIDFFVSWVNDIVEGTRKSITR